MTMFVLPTIPEPFEIYELRVWSMVDGLSIFLESYNVNNPVEDLNCSFCICKILWDLFFLFRTPSSSCQAVFMCRWLSFDAAVTRVIHSHIIFQFVILFALLLSSHRYCHSLSCYIVTVFLRNLSSWILIFILFYFCLTRETWTNMWLLRTLPSSFSCNNIDLCVEKLSHK